jgi:hypothetical protein
VDIDLTNQLLNEYSAFKKGGEKLQYSAKTLSFIDFKKPTTY